MEVEAVAVSNQVILCVKTYDGSDAHVTEYFEHTIINGNVMKGKDPVWYILVNVSWTSYDDGDEYRQMSLSYGDEKETFDLGYINNIVDIDANYVDPSTITSPGQKYYWIETDLGVGQPDKNETWNVFTSGNWFSCGQITSTDHNLTWWTDWDQGEYQGMRQIYLEDWHQNTKALAWVEDTGASLTLYLEVYGQATMPYLRERINWTINNGDKSGAYFNVYINSDDIPQSWTSPNLYPGAGAEFEEIGSLDNLTVDLYYMDPC